MLNNLPSVVVLDLQEELMELYRLSNDQRFRGIDIPSIVYQIFEAINSIEINEKHFIINNVILDLSHENTLNGAGVVDMDSNLVCAATTVINRTCIHIENTLRFLGGPYHEILCYVFDRMLDETTVVLIPFTDATPDNYPL